MKANPLEFNVAKSIEGTESSTREKYVELVEEDLEEEVERILKKGSLLGEGKAGKVFDLEMRRSHTLPACVKIWRPELEHMRETNPIEYRKRQFLSPREEFELQDELFMAGFTNVPRPLVYRRIGRYHTLAMEKIRGYTLQELIDADAHIVNLSWKDLGNLAKQLASEYHVVHRDLHPGNIFLETKCDLKEKEMSGILRLIDFGLAKRIHGSPEPEDFRLTLGNHMIKYKEDVLQVEALRPHAPGSPFLS